MAPQQPSSITGYCQRFGDIAIAHGFLTAAQLQQALAEQQADSLAGRPHRVIGAICFTHGWMTPPQIDLVLNQLFRSRARRSNCQPQPPALAG